MAAITPTGSTLDSKISTGLSTQITVKVENTIVGAIQNLDISQNRNLERVKELGFDGVLEIVPNRPTEYNASITRIVFDRLRLPEAFERGFINIKSQLIPFDILIIDNSETVPITHTLVNCWFTRYNPRYTADSFIITETAEVYFEDIRSTIGNSAQNAARGGARGIKPLEIDRERKADAGGFRGTMDVPDIVGIFNGIFK